MDKIRIPRRTRFLQVLCTLSAVNATYGMISGLVNAVATPEIDERAIDDLMERISRFAVPIEGFTEAVEAYYLNMMLNLGNLGAASFLCYGISLVAVIMMLRLNRIGFVLYSAAQVGLALVPAIFGSFNMVGQMALAFTLLWNLLWVGMYATQLKFFVGHSH